MDKQLEWLKECLSANKNTLYGKQYNFHSIATMQMYRQEVPLVTYRDIEKYIDMISKGSEDVLFNGSAVAFEKTGGSSGGSKLIPYTKRSFRDFQRAILPYLEKTYYTYGIDPKNTYWSISPAVHTTQKTASGITIGVKDSDYLGFKETNSSLVPEWVSELEEIKTWKIATLYWLIRAEDLEFISIWSPTFLLVLLESIEEYETELKNLLLSGGEISGHKVLPDIKSYERFVHYLDKKNTKILWGSLKLISLWQDGSSSIYSKELKSFFPRVHFESKGLLSTEGIVSIPKDGLPILSDNSGFYEFISIDNEVYFAHELKNGAEYEVVLTTNGGLYRYKTDDVVICDGYSEGRPILRFSHRKGIISDMVGEKLTEDFVSSVTEDISGFAMLVPHIDSQRYSLVVDEKTNISKETIEDRLFLNPQYRYARELGQLKPLNIIKLQNPIKHYMDRMVLDGKRIGDIKIPILANNDRWLK